MIIGKIKRVNQWDNNEIVYEEIEFTNVSQIEDYIAYNRAYITEIKFIGAIKVERD